MCWPPWPKARGASSVTIAMVGYDGGAIAEIWPTTYRRALRAHPRIQEAQASAYHVLCERRLMRPGRIEGTVQGVGFAPSSTGWPTSWNWVDGGSTQPRRAPGGGGQSRASDESCADWRRSAPPLAVIESVETQTVEPSGAAGFTIRPSPLGGVVSAPVTAAARHLPDCLGELFDPADRRGTGYLIINCTNYRPATGTRSCAVAPTAGR